MGACWHCCRYDGITDGYAALCSAPNHARVQANPERGCSSFLREVGSDDVPEWRPAGISADPVGDGYRAIRAAQERSLRRAAILGKRPGQA